LSAVRGRATLVNLWTSWCAPCRREMPLLQATHERTGDAAGFLGVNASAQRSSALNFLATFGVTYLRWSTRPTSGRRRWGSKAFPSRSTLTPLVRSSTGRSASCPRPTCRKRSPRPAASHPPRRSGWAARCPAVRAEVAVRRVWRPGPR
ncbi:MAG: TlpA family protein disulfide reductase, partial [Geodermatophilaceae bacterium]|nr:TlpA family protein disulfide reductase [Geodermatophilaceae bacterium]